ncbi:EcoAI/FtnUII family type I restriction enzme subunit R [Methanospirillum stamsii]|uniref:EcoAI/FtnUII family type I restriction enzme subunit R n=1 Tax=Methanospirillum stamsii TaxID=1277351 RepID=UPI001C63C671|nr:DEAD/DEAH box helicase family protein [Methanospirillum stamsii]
MTAIDKKSLSERDICSKYITPAIERAGWHLLTQVREEVNITKGRVIVTTGTKPKRAEPRFADYILYYKPNIPVAVIEAKDNNHSVGAGMQQALGYAELIDVPFVFSSNGDAFLFHDKTGQSSVIEQELSLDAFPSPEVLWNSYCVLKGINSETSKIVTQDYFDDGSGKTPRYYQIIAINRTMEAIAKGQRRILLVMATGTGKTYTAFQIIWRLWKAGSAKRILFLADRNILVDQTKTNDFKPFGKAMTKITNRKIDKSYEIYLSLYQAITGTEDIQNIYKEFSPDFFDLVVIDECHRGSAAEDAAWRDILTYFNSAIHIGLTATPKETEYVSNTNYFGEPIYTYSLKQGIEDGFLAPYRVIRIDLDKDLAGWRPEKGKRDLYGQEIEDRIYYQKDFDNNLVLTKRTELVAKKVSDYLKKTDPYDKTIIFCENIDHAERMRQSLVNENSQEVLKSERYVVRITGDSPEGKAELDNFIMPDSRYPVIATTSKLMSTGVDAQTCKVIVLDKSIESMIEFKQIIGRGTRINEEYNKYFFTIIDFRKATERFADPEFDGDPIQDPDFDPRTGSGGTGGGEPPHPPPDPPEPSNSRKYVVKDVEVSVVAERVQYYGPDGRLITESLKDYTRKNVIKSYATLDDFLTQWTASERKTAIIEELQQHGVLFDALAEEVGRDLDPFDLICHVAYGQPKMTRRQRADRVKKAKYFAEFGDQARAVLISLLDKYADEGVENLESIDVLKVDPFPSFGTPIEIVKGIFGSKSNYLATLHRIEQCLYNPASC